MLVYKSGSLAREWVRDQYCKADWDTFNADVEAFRLGDGEKRVGFYWLRPEIIPSGASGVHRYIAGNADEWSKVDNFAKEGMNASTILETQFLNYRYRSSSIVAGPTSSSSSAPDTSKLPLASIYAVGELLPTAPSLKPWPTFSDATSSSQSNRAKTERMGCSQLQLLFGGSGLQGCLGLEQAAEWQ